MPCKSGVPGHLAVLHEIHSALGTPFLSCFLFFFCPVFFFLLIFPPKCSERFESRCLLGVLRMSGCQLSLPRVPCWQIKLK